MRRGPLPRRVSLRTGDPPRNCGGAIFPGAAARGYLRAFPTHPKNGSDSLSDTPSWSADEIVPLLERVELFSGLPDDVLRGIAEIVRGQQVEAGTTLFEEGDAGDAYFVVYSGAVEIRKGRDKLAVRRQGDGFGEMALLDDAPRSAAAVVVEDCQLMRITRDDFRGLLGEDSLPLRMMKVLSTALRALDVRFANAERAAEQGGPALDLETVSRMLQRGMIPSEAPSVEGFDVAAGTTLEDAGRGSTIWDHVRMKDGRVALLVLDIRADGFPPAHVAGTARAALRTAAATTEDAAELLRRANGVLADMHVDGVDQFVECGVLIPHTDGVVWASAGRMPAGVLGREGTFKQLGTHGPPLGMMDGFGYGSETVEVGAGDTALVLSGGSTGLFRGAADLVSQVVGKPAGEVVATVHKAVRRAQEAEETTEEVSVVYLRRH